MTDVLLQFDEPLLGADDVPYTARICGRADDAGHWEGWVEFVPRAGGESCRTGRETLQPSRAELAQWAMGISRAYLAAALERALFPPPPTDPAREPAGHADLPRTHTPRRPWRAWEMHSTTRTEAPRTVLDPFALYARGETALQEALRALSADHLEDIISAYALSPGRRAAGVHSTDELVSQIVAAVRARRSRG